MRLIVVVATSQDGYITKGDDPNPSSWTSTEDQRFYQEIKEKHKLLVFGKNTYNGKNKSPDPSHMTIILTRTPDKYVDRSVTGVLEFASLSPQEFVKKYENQYESCLILGGSYVYTSFLEAGVIDEIYMTIEPVDHGSGIPFIGSGKKLEQLVSLPEPEITKLNDSGTILKHYILKK